MPVPSFPVTVQRSDFLRTALNWGLTEGVFFDTKFYVYSRRRSSGAVDKPIPVYANSAILFASSPYLEDLLAISPLLARRDSVGDVGPSFTPVALQQDYGYESDSDLEDGDEDETEDDEKLLSTIFSEEVVEPACLGGGLDGDEISLCGDTSPPSSISGLSDEFPAKSGGSEVATDYNILIPHFAFPTWRALVFYLCTGTVVFAPLSSQGQFHGSPLPSLITPNAPQCSPKSMYRLAHEVGLDALKSMALNDIRSKLSPANILDELFSEFTSRYPAVLEMELAYIRDQGHQAPVIKLLPNLAKHLVDGSLPHSATVLASLMEGLLLQGAPPRSPGSEPACPPCDPLEEPGPYPPSEPPSACEEKALHPAGEDLSGSSADINLGGSSNSDVCDSIFSNGVKTAGGCMKKKKKGKK